MKVHRRAAVAVAAAVITTTGVAVVVTAPGAAARGFGYQNLNKIQRAHVSGLLAAELGPRTGARPVSVRPALGTPEHPGAHGCPATRGSNVKVNQNCLNLTDADLQGRGQAQNETWIAADPNNPSHVVASYNDYRRGDGTCGVSYSLNGGATWADATTPNGFVRGDFTGHARQYWQASGDTSVAWDTKGNVYLSCQAFNRGSGVSANPDQSSGMFVFRSTGTDGASFNFPGRPVVTHDDTAGAGNFLLDKQLMTVDDNPASPYADRIYVTWTTYAADGTAYIYEAHSSDYGETFSAPVLVSRDSSRCPNTFGLATPQGRCNENQYSDPFVGSDGALYVVYANFNNAVSGNDNRSQVLLARSGNGGASFGAPVYVGDYYDLPDCDTYQGTGSDPFRACVPEKGSSHNSVFRAANYPIGAADPTDPNHVVVSYGSYVNRDSNESHGCTPDGFAADGLNKYVGVKSGNCNNDIVLSESRDHGATFSGRFLDVRQLPVISDGAAQATTDQYFQGMAYAADGTLVASYRDRGYGRDNTTGYDDITVSQASGGGFVHTRATSSSMPPPTEFSGQFAGDYEAVGVAGSTALPVWSDSRQPDEFACPGTPPAVCGGTAPNAPYANDEDVYTTRVALGG